MENSSFVALSRQAILRRKLDMTSNNLANVNTPAFKSERLVFREFVAKAENTGRLSYVQDYGVSRDESEGPITQTGNSLDLSIEGEGFFQINTPLGPRFTRHGAFKLDAENALVTNEGYRVQGAGGDIVFPPGANNINISEDGTVSANGEQVALIELVDFENTRALRKTANSYYVTDQEPQRLPQASVRQGTLEQSNVKAVVEMTSLISIHREHTSMANFVRSEDERMKKAIRDLSAKN